MDHSDAIRAPGRWLVAALFYALLCAVVTTVTALGQPWMGVGLKAQDDQVRLVSSEGPSAGIPAGTRLLAIAAPGRTAIALQADDLLEEPDVVPGYVEMDGFFARQGQLADIQSQPEVWLTVQADGQTPREYQITPGKRPLHALPLLYWFQIVISVIACAIASWVWVLRPGDWAVRIFGFTGLLFPLFAMPAAIYGTRELALPQAQFFALSAMNHCAAFQWGAALSAIFMIYPRPLVKSHHLVWPFLFALLAWLADVTRTAPDLDWGNRFVVMAEMTAAIGLAVVQWVRSKGEPIDRAALRWFILSMLVGSTLFIITAITTVSLGWLPPIPQGYAFGFFLLIYLGIALGLRSYRLFELDVWAFRLLVWMGSALAVVVMDAALVAALGWSGGVALGVSMWVCGLLYFPLRQWAWQKLVRQPALQRDQLIPDLINIAFQSSSEARQLNWEALLRRLFEPLELMPVGHAPAAHAMLNEGGLSLDVPPCSGILGMRLRYPDLGRRLFSHKDVAFVSGLIDLVNQAQTGRMAYDRGALEERRRIARDMHDDVGARLLMLIHRAPDPGLASLAREAMNDLRSALANLDTGPRLLSDSLADWRAEAADRCEAAGAVLLWQSPEQEPTGRLSARRTMLLERTLREGITNALKHAAPQSIYVQTEIDAQGVHLRIRNDGKTSDPATWAAGRGLSAMRQRVTELGGALQIEQTGTSFTELKLWLPNGPDPLS